MKRLLIIFLILAVALSMFACGKKEQEIQRPVNFYYLGILNTKDDFDDIIVTEVREGRGYENASEELVALYLKGPGSDSAVNPFPDELSINTLTYDNQTVKIDLSKHFSKLTGLDLTLACTCLCLTLFELYEAQTVLISAEGAPLGGQTLLSFERNDLVLADISYAIVSD